MFKKSRQIAVSLENYLALERLRSTGYLFNSTLTEVLKKAILQQNDARIGHSNHFDDGGDESINRTDVQILRSR
jgi:hypothetical protein